MCFAGQRVARRPAGRGCTHSISRHDIELRLREGPSSRCGRGHGRAGIVVGGPFSIRIGLGAGSTLGGPSPCGGRERAFGQLDKRRPVPRARPAV